MPRERTETPFQRLRNALKINKLDLDNELVEHPGHLFEVGSAYARAVSERDGQKEYLKQLEAKLSIEVREALSSAAKKPTQAAVSAEVEAKDEWIEARETFLDRCHEADTWAALKEAYIQRGFALNNLVQIQISNLRAEHGTSYTGP